MDVGTAAHDFPHIVLNVAPQTLPVSRTPAERWKIAEIRVPVSEAKEFVMVVGVLFRTASEQKPNLLSLVARPISKKPLQNGSKGSNPSSGRDQQSVAHGWT